MQSGRNNMILRCPVECFWPLLDTISTQLMDYTLPTVISRKSTQWQVALMHQEMFASGSQLKDLWKPACAYKPVQLCYCSSNRGWHGPGVCLFLFEIQHHASVQLLGGSWLIGQWTPDWMTSFSSSSKNKITNVCIHRPFSFWMTNTDDHHCFCGVIFTHTCADVCACWFKFHFLAQMNMTGDATVNIRRC